jgi:glycosyltransferase involved in cell wall biosynthesis
LEDNVRLLGFQENPYKFFKNADLFVLSSLWEGLGQVLIEALASGTLVVSTDCPSGPSEIIEGDYGKLVKVEDSEDLANGIISMLKKENKEELIELGKKRAEDFRSTKIIKEYENLFLN